MNEFPLAALASWDAGHRPLAMTASEFLLWPGDGTGRKCQLIDGEVWAMSPASPRHGFIQANLSQLLLNAIEEASLPLRVATEGAIVPALHAADNVRVPDLVVAVDEGSEGDANVINNPLALVEILSPGNKSLTRNNVRAYATLPSVREIVVVHISRMEVEVLRREDTGAWPADPEVVKPGGVLRLETVSLACAVERVYARTGLVRRDVVR